MYRVKFCTGIDNACVAAHLDFVVNMTITTDYYMEPRGEFDGLATPTWPKLAMSAARKEHIPTTILPFEIVAFDTPSFTYTLMASNYQASPSFIKSSRQCEKRTRRIAFSSKARCRRIDESTFDM